MQIQHVYQRGGEYAVSVSVRNAVGTSSANRAVAVFDGRLVDEFDRKFRACQRLDGRTAIALARVLLLGAAITVVVGVIARVPLGAGSLLGSHHPRDWAIAATLYIAAPLCLVAEWVQLRRTAHSRTLRSELHLLRASIGDFAEARPPSEAVSEFDATVGLEGTAEGRVTLVSRAERRSNDLRNDHRVGSLTVVLLVLAAVAYATRWVAIGSTRAVDPAISPDEVRDVFTSRIDGDHIGLAVQMGAIEAILAVAIVAPALLVAAAWKCAGLLSVRAQIRRLTADDPSSRPQRSSTHTVTTLLKVFGVAVVSVPIAAIGAAAGYVVTWIVVAIPGALILWLLDHHAFSDPEVQYHFLPISAVSIMTVWFIGILFVVTFSGPLSE